MTPHRTRRLTAYLQLIPTRRTPTAHATPLANAGRTQPPPATATPTSDNSPQPDDNTHSDPRPPPPPPTADSDPNRRQQQASADQPADTDRNAFRWWQRLGNQSGQQPGRWQPAQCAAYSPTPTAAIRGTTATQQTPTSEQQRVSCNVECQQQIPAVPTATLPRATPTAKRLQAPRLQPSPNERAATQGSGNQGGGNNQVGNNQGGRTTVAKTKATDQGGRRLKSFINAGRFRASPVHTASSIHTAVRRRPSPSPCPSY